ncbi:GNAT family N-acetyltransferase [Paenibacillus cymbidii]|uniref:GNAT family N-acetyltransferase n=1 Tax=Paenibacillus cymbidii TaxID=1639034 RepID=UPI0010808658|nr:GNAT family N-acetyltransferase [Paenibacillus cymbidii]
MDIRVDDLTDAQVIALIDEHRRGMFASSPPESVHSLDLSGLKQADVTLWSAWENGELLGIGALKELDAAHGEIKSMRTSSAHLRRGAGRQLLAHIIAAAKERGYRRLSLETGSEQLPAFAPARQLYERFGFAYCGPFAQYAPDPYSSFMTLEL